MATAREGATEQALAAVRGCLHGAETPPVYLAAGQPSVATALLAAVAAEVRSVGRDERLLACTGADFADLWRDTPRRGMTAFVRRALAAKRVILLDGLEALRGEPFAQEELARLIVPERLVVLAGRDHLHRVGGWAPLLAAPLETVITLCLHEGPCVSMRTPGPSSTRWPATTASRGRSSSRGGAPPPSHWRARSLCTCCARRV